MKSAEKAWRQSHHSKAGDPPFVQTGTLRRGISWQKAQNAMVRRIGAIKSVHYALYLELGTSRMAKRPYLRPALRKNKAKLLAIIGGKK